MKKIRRDARLKKIHGLDQLIVNKLIGLRTIQDVTQYSCQELVSKYSLTALELAVLLDALHTLGYSTAIPTVKSNRHDDELIEKTNLHKFIKDAAREQGMTRVGEVRRLSMVEFLSQPNVSISLWKGFQVFLLS